MTSPSDDPHVSIHPVAALLRQAARSVVLLRPAVQGLQAGPGLMLILVLAVVAEGVWLQRLGHDDAVVFYWQAIGSGWLGTLLLLWACWLARGPRQDNTPDVPTLFALLLIQQILITLPLWGLYVLLPTTDGAWLRASAWLRWAIPYLVMAWVALAAVVLLLRHMPAGPRRALVAGVVLLVVALDVYIPPAPFWYLDPQAARAGGPQPPRLALTQEMMERQSGTLINALNAMQPERLGVIDVYAITFAPYASENVFRRESRLVVDLMQSRFDAQGRTLELLNHAETAAELPWATGLNLQRAIQRAASLMNRDEDVLFIHLTSHGAKDGQLAADFEPLQVDAITPVQLRGWLDEAGVRYRVLSISACYSGSWLPALTEPGTLVMTAADADHTSYGCGHRSELTFFGRAMYAEELRKTRSFETAHAAARQVIARREQEAGKTDGYSNPQLVVGEAIRPVLGALTSRLDAVAP